MADWTDPPYPQLVAGKPWTDEKASAAFENVEALAEAAPGSPRVQGVALGGISLGAVTVTGTGGQGWIGLDRVGLVYMTFVVGEPNNRTLRVRFSSDNGSTYGSWQNLSIFSTGGTDVVSSGNLRLNIQTGGWNIQRIDINNTASPSAEAAGVGGTVTVPLNTNAFQLSWNVSAPTGYFDAYCLGGIE